MKSSATALILPLALVFLCRPAEIRGGEPPAAADLVRAVIERQQTSGFRARARVETVNTDGAAASAQILVKGRRDGPRSRLLIAAMWPAGVKGSGMMIDRRPGQAVAGFRFEPEGPAHDLREEALDEELFGTAIRPSDFIQPFWEWPEQEITGSGMAGREDCWILLSRPQAGRAYPLARTAVSKDKLVPVRIELFGADGAPAAAVYFQRLARREDGGWSPASFIIEAPPGGRRTSVSFSRGERDVTVPEEEFARETFRQYLGPGR